MAKELNVRFNNLSKFISSKLEKILINMISDSGYPGIKFEKKVDFTKLFNEKFN